MVMNKFVFSKKLFVFLLSTVLLFSLLIPSMGDPKVVNGEALVYQDPNAAIPDRVTDLLARMSLDEKIGQMTQVDRTFLNSDNDIATYYLGSLLSGGGSAPTPNTPETWADMYDHYQSIALTNNLSIPIIYGIDAVHGHNNVYGATVFPHNIGLGATRNPTLLNQIGEVTAKEVAGTGIDWTFAPALSVARNERWGRTYESYGEDPEIASSYATIIEGLQGTNLNDPSTILATAKHWVGDGGTTGGDDQGDTQISEQDLRDIHIAPYINAINSGVGSIMISYSSWNSEKLHGHDYLIHDVLKGELGFDGFIVSDWAAIDQLPGDYASDVRTSINAGIDMIMIPDNYVNFINTLRTEVNEGRISMNRIDDAVSRILTKKFELGLFENPYTDRTFTASIGSQEHRDVAREAVRQSLVLLKNEGNILPLSKDLNKVFVAGKNADNIGNQSGGWTISWQGTSGDITSGTTILEGIQNTVSPNTTVTYNERGIGIKSDYDVAIVVIGERPYAEGNGDKQGSFGLERTDLTLLDKMKRAGVPTVVILVSGRPLIITDQLTDWNALVEAWLPGTEGDGVADVIFGDYNFTGTLPMSWPLTEEQIPINIGDPQYDPLFPYGFGLTYQP
ncbi:glycoside hydrolase family 3 protein [Chengkuizengella sediminis]|uniref:glycoside hydrolase family 3 protein n=1 Tax=Chengkuizengella sediminis TaxID=1885917 RepID=UPI00147920EF|nr:glycoside hydrolase family 3 N-terminal domain-containing protein [Chengkuizengella sediminis]NDI36187.1 beta-glucosidase [Chengkuizengella sediminis]